MLDGRRHSVDVPLSKTLLALKRVRSLRDPETNSTDRISMFIENINWETNSPGDPILSLNHDPHSDRGFDPDSIGLHSDRVPNKVISRARRKFSLRPDLSPIDRNRDDEMLDFMESTDEEDRPASPRSLGRKYCPRSFDDLIGQSVVVQSLSTAICRRQISPIYLFHGPHGSGKTSTARIFASGLNCRSPGDQIPCGTCKDCMNRDVEEVDHDRVDSKDNVKLLFKRAPIYSKYRVFIIDQCHQLGSDTWTAILNGVRQRSSQAVFIMITSDIEKLPQISLSSCQKYHFPRIKDADIVRRLQKICLAEAFDFEDGALTFIAARSNGSLREAETMLDQLSLLGKKITLPLAQELAGVVSEEELLDLLDLALSCDAPNTVRRARELLDSKVDPMQLTSQLANLIMDILAGRNFLRRHVLGDVGVMQKLRNALKVLSETDKQLRSSKSRATWLTVALLQFNTGDSADEPFTLAQQTMCNSSDDMLMSRSLSAREIGVSNCNARRKLDAVWRATIELCQSDLSGAFLKKGRLTSLYLDKGLATAKVQFSSPEQVSRAKASCKLINSSLQRVLCQEVELQISLGRCSSLSKAKELTFRLLGCSSSKRRHNFLDSRVHREMSGSNSSSRKCGLDFDSQVTVSEEVLPLSAKLHRSNASSFRERLGFPLLSRKASLEAFLCNKVPSVFKPKGKM